MAQVRTRTSNAQTICLRCHNTGWTVKHAMEMQMRREAALSGQQSFALLSMLSGQSQTPMCPFLHEVPDECSPEYPARCGCPPLPCPMCERSSL